jgi:hypothetical protein
MHHDASALGQPLTFGEPIGDTQAFLNLAERQHSGIG